jgi:general secretion pathway protein K
MDSTVISRKGVVRRSIAGRSERGVALAIVVWFLAAMSLLVAGIVFQARVDTRLAQVHVARAQAVAAADGAIKLFLADRAASNPGAEALSAGEYLVGGQQVRVELVATAGLIDLRKAPRELLAALFQARAGAGEEEARTMADNVLKLQPGGYFSKGQRESKKARLNAVEDVLRAPGVGRAALDAIRDVVVVGGGAGTFAVDWTLAPPEVLAVLAATNPDKAAALAANAAGPGGGNKKFGGRPGASGKAFRIDALVRDLDHTWLRRRWVTLGGGRSEGLPWRFYRTEFARVVSRPGATADKQDRGV